VPETYPTTSPDLAPTFCLADSITQLSEASRGCVIVTGSHGGLFSGAEAARRAVRGVIFNDAGVGLDSAGVAGLPVLDTIGVPAAAAAHDSAPVGDAAGSAETGILSHVNAAARELGCRVGMTVAEAAAHMELAAPPGDTGLEVGREARHLLFDGGECSIWALDSASLVRPDDAGHIVITGSHGGLIGGHPDSALKVAARLAVFNDAGTPLGSGGTRLAVLAGLGIPAATVSTYSARIGDARSTYFDGVVSNVNSVAAAGGARKGMSTKEFVFRMTGVIVDGAAATAARTQRG
jgi:hypothetical protein